MKPESVLPLCQHSLTGFAIANWDRYRAAHHHRLIAKKLQEVSAGKCKRLMIQMPPRHGKQVDDSTPVLTTAGWKRHGDLKAGDFVFGVNGKPVAVLAVAAPLLQDCEVEFTDGSRVLCHENHEWTVYDRSKAALRTLETKAIEKRKLWSGPLGCRGGRAVLQLPERQSLQMPEADLPLHPYVLGVWLGDGRSSQPDFCWASNDEIVALTVNELRPITRTWVHKTTGVNYGYLSGAKDLLRKLGLLNNKHVPALYLLSSEAQRLELLAGLIDTDGHVESKTNRVRIATVSDALAEGIEVLVRSFGWRANRYTQQPAESSSGVVGKSPVHYVSFTPDAAIPTRLPRKRIEGSKGARRAIGFASVRRVAPSIGRCIQVDADDGLYLVGKELIPTHNSMLASEYFPAWYLGQHPDHQIIHATYGQDLADNFGRKVRNLMREPLYNKVFPGVTLADDSQAAARFHTSKGGVYHGVGIGGGATGKGANLLLIDDPVKDRADAESEVMRERAKDWYKSVAYTRLMPEGAIVVIQTRWHEDDLSGWILREHAHEGWEVLKLPAINEQGEALWPESYPVERLTEIEQTIGPRDFQALYQQEPRPQSGGEFKRHWVQHYGSVDHKLMSIVMLVDPASGKRKNNDYTSIWVIGLGQDENYYALDIVRDRLNLTERAEAVFRLHRKWKPIEVRYERYGMMADIEHIKAEQERRSYRFPIREVGGATKKEDRIRRLVPLFERGRFYLPTELTYTGTDGVAHDLIHQFIEAEYLAFPVGRHDDMLDSLARLVEPGMDLPFPDNGPGFSLPVIGYGVLDNVMGI